MSWAGPMSSRDNTDGERRGAAGEAEAGLPMGRLVSRDVTVAIAVLRANPHRRVPAAELARQAGVAGRTLHEHFQTFIGMPPGEYGRRVRGAGVRGGLRQSAGRGSVARTAARYGFSHLGRFAEHYRQIFGELPSATQRHAAAPASRANR